MASNDMRPLAVNVWQRLVVPSLTDRLTFAIGSPSKEAFRLPQRQDAVGIIVCYSWNLEDFFQELSLVHQ